MLTAHLTEPLVPVTERRAKIPAPLAQLIMGCLEKKPADRPQTADELLRVLESLATPSRGMTPTDTAPAAAVRPRAALYEALGGQAWNLRWGSSIMAGLGRKAEAVALIPSAVEAHTELGQTRPGQVGSWGCSALPSLAGIPCDL